MFDKMKQFMEMKKQADSLKKQLEAMTVESEEVKGIKIVMDGAQTLQSVKIEESYYSANSREALERDILRSIRAASKKAQGVAAQKMASGLSGMR